MNFVGSEMLARPEMCLSQSDLLRLLSETEAAPLIPHLKIVQSKLGDILFHAEETADYVFFPLLPGAVLKIKLDKLRPEFARGGTLQDAIHGYTRYALTQIAQTAVCNRAHRLNK
jgi:hypothetical protein